MLTIAAFIWSKYSKR